MPTFAMLTVRLVFPVLESRNTVSRKGSESFGLKVENLGPFWNTLLALENWENK